MAGGEVRRLPDPGGHAVRVRGAHPRHQEEDPRPERGEALRHRGPGRGHRVDERQRTSRDGVDMTTAGERLDSGVRSELAWRALGQVRAPELDEPITDLLFV